MKYTDVCEAKTREEMVARFDALLAEVAAKHGGTPESHRAVQMQNVGYFMGYYDHATFSRVNEWLGAIHPVFGGNYPAPAQALAAGKQSAQNPLQEKT